MYATSTIFLSCSKYIWNGMATCFHPIPNPHVLTSTIWMLDVDMGLVWDENKCPYHSQYNMIIVAPIPFPSFIDQEPYEFHIMFPDHSHIESYLTHSKVVMK